MPIDREAATPLYMQLAAILRDQIQSGEMAGRVPSLTQLMAAYDLADPTVRAALRVLREERLIETAPGRGTFVRRPE